MNDPAIECAALRERVQTLESEREILHAQMRLSVFAHGHSLEELLRKTLDELETLTGSRIGFFHFVDDDQRTLRLQAWSTNTLEKMCNAEGAGQHYDIDKAGVWVDCVRERRPVIHNDYATVPHRKGLPPGHAPVVRELCVPVFDSDRIAAVVGVGNKPADYEARDVDCVSTLATLVWDLAGRMRAEEAVRNMSELLERVFSNTHIMIAYMDKSFNFIRVNPAYARADGRAPDFFTGKNHFDLYPNAENKSIFCDVVKTGVPYSTYAKSFVYPAEPERGVTYWDWSLHPIKGPGETVNGLLLALVNVTGRKRAEDDVMRSHEALRNLAVRLQSVREEERAALSRELHDELGQTLTALNLDAAWLEKHLRRDQPAQTRKIADMKALVRESLNTIRRISADLRPALIDDIGLWAAIKDEASQFTERSGIACTLDIEEQPIIEKSARSPAFRILQETLTNVARHAAATEVTISWRIEGDRAVLTVGDNGRGVPAAALDDPRSLGIVGMRERALALGGELTITGMPGTGTTVTLSVPMSPEGMHT